MASLLRRVVRSGFSDRLMTRQSISFTQNRFMGTVGVSFAAKDGAHPHAVAPSPAHVKAKPYDYRLPGYPHNLALLVIDLQKDFIEPGGFGESLGNDVKRLQRCIEPCRKLLTLFRELQLPIYHTVEAHRPDLLDCPPSKRLRGRARMRIGDKGPMGRILIAGEPGNAIVPEVAPLPSEMCIAKPGKSAFWETNLGHFLNEQKVSHLVIAGVTTEVCVQTTMREANDHGFECLLVEECTESYFQHFKDVCIEMIIAQGGLVGWVAKLKDVEEGVRRWYDAFQIVPQP